MTKASSWSDIKKEKAVLQSPVLAAIQQPFENNKV